MVIVSRRPRDGTGEVEIGEWPSPPPPTSAATHRHSPGQGAPGSKLSPSVGVPSHMPGRRRVVSGYPRYMPYDESTPVFLATRFFNIVTALNVLLILVLLLLRLVVRHWCTKRDLVSGAASQNVTDGSWRLDAAYLQQLQRVTERTFFRRRMKQAVYYHEANYALMPTFSCPQKRRVGSTSSFFVLCAPQHLWKLHWPMAYGLRQSPDIAYEAELFKQFNVQTTIFDPSLPLGKGVSRDHPFVNVIGGGDAEPTLAKFMLDSSTSHGDAKARWGDKSKLFYGGTPFLRVSCYGCEAEFLLPVLQQPGLSFPAATPSAGQIVLRLDRWWPPFDATSKKVLAVLEQAGYHMFHAEQVFGSWKDQSYLVSFIHQSVLFPKMLGVNYTWNEDA